MPLTRPFRLEENAQYSVYFGLTLGNDRLVENMGQVLSASVLLQASTAMKAV